MAAMDANTSGTPPPPAPDVDQLTPPAAVAVADNPPPLPASSLVEKSNKRKLQDVDPPIPMRSNDLLPAVTSLGNSTASMIVLLPTLPSSPTDRKVRSVTIALDTLMTKLRTMCMYRTSKPDQFRWKVNAHRVMPIVQDLEATSALMLPLLPLMPDAARKKVLEQERLISELRSRVIMAAMAPPSVLQDYTPSCFECSGERSEHANSSHSEQSSSGSSTGYHDTEEKATESGHHDMEEYSASSVTPVQ